MDWEFLHAVLIKLGFDSKWHQWVMECISTVTYNVMINGEPSQEFTPSRGMRQGDSSPYLFLFIQEAFFKLIIRAVEVGTYTE